MTQLMTSPRKRTGSLPLNPELALRGASELAAEVTRSIAHDPQNFDHALTQIELVTRRFRSACLASTHPEADAALAYHDRAQAELDDEYVPLYYRRAVLENVVQRYERAAGALLRAFA